MNRRSAEITKSKILGAASKVFIENGYSQASMREIAGAAEISVGCLYLHFTNKDALFHTLMQQWMKDLDEKTREALSDIEDPEEAVKVFVSMTIEFARSHKEIIMLQGRELGFSFGLELKREFFRKRRLFLSQIISEGMARGTFTQCDAEEVAKIIYNTLRGFIFSMVIDEEALFSAENCCNLMLNGLVRRNRV